MGTSLFDALGGRAGVAALVAEFYDEMERAPAAATIRAMHPEDLASSREKLELFLVGWTGGPPVYVERHGHPRLRARHLPFPIGDAEAAAWMACMDHALAKTVDDDALRGPLREAFARLAAHMRNQEVTA